ncbi:MAG: fasciclin domain-containing protein [Mariniphaga sp.]
MKRKAIVTVFIISLIIGSCKREYGVFYDPPKGQKGAIYQQLAADPTLSTFVLAIDKVPGLKDELSSSGLFTVMAPDNDAFTSFFAKNALYKSVDAIPVDTLAPLIKFHIMKWMLFQVNFLNPGLTGIDYSMFKYETRATVAYKERTITGKLLPIFYTSKLAQVYTPNYLANSGVTTADYTDIYGTSSVLNTTTKMNVMGASVKKTDIAGGNGVYYIIDRVIQPPANIAQELDNNPEYVDYNKLLKSSFVSYSYNKAGTIAQGNNGDVNGDGLVDSLWVRNYRSDANLDNENPLSSNKRDRLSLSAYIPSKAAFKQYLDTKLLPAFFNNADSIPKHTLLMLFQSHITNTLDWPSKIDKGYVANILGDKLTGVTRADIISKKMASNGFFYCLNKVIEPKAFSAVTGPAFFSSKYWYFAEMLVMTGMLPSLTSTDMAFTILAPTNTAFNKRNIYWDNNPVNGIPGFYRKVGGVSTALGLTEIMAITGNHIILNKSMSVSGLVNGYYPLQNSTYIAIENGKIHGSERDSIPNIIEPDLKMSNGYFHGIDKLIINPQKSVFDQINGTNATAVPPITPEFLKFKELCSAAGILAKDFGSIMAVDANKKFTLFVPSNAALIAAQVAGKLPKTGAVTPNTVLTAANKLQLISYLRYFFVPEQQIFTDGLLKGTFLSFKLDALSTPGNDIFVPVTISLPILTVTDNKGTVGKVDILQPLVFPQNTLCKDGVIQITDNAFTSQY